MKCQYFGENMDCIHGDKKPEKENCIVFQAYKQGRTDILEGYYPAGYDL